VNVRERVCFHRCRRRHRHFSPPPPRCPRRREYRCCICGSTRRHLPLYDFLSRDYRQLHSTRPDNRADDHCVIAVAIIAAVVVVVVVVVGGRREAPDVIVVGTTDPTDYPGLLATRRFLALSYDDYGAHHTLGQGEQSFVFHPYLSCIHASVMSIPPPPPPLSPLPPFPHLVSPCASPCHRFI